MNLFSILGFGAATQPAVLERPAIVRQIERPAAVEAAKPAAPLQVDPLRAASLAHANACRSGCDQEMAMARALEALAYADFSTLELNGPHTRASDRVSKKALKKAQRVFLALAETGPIF